MTPIEELEHAIDQLPPEDFTRLAEWIREREQQRWDEQMDRDAAAGKLRFLTDEAEEDARQGLLREWPSPI